MDIWQKMGNDETNDKQKATRWWTPKADYRIFASASKLRRCSMFRSNFVLGRPNTTRWTVCSGPHSQSVIIYLTYYPNIRECQTGRCDPFYQTDVGRVASVVFGVRHKYRRLLCPSVCGSITSSGRRYYNAINKRAARGERYPWDRITNFGSL